MYNSSTNLYIFIIFVATLAFELLITKLMDMPPALLWGFTIGIYMLFILFQALVRFNEDVEKNKAKALLYDLMDSINGIPVMNKNEKLIIKWDIVFKKLVDHKEYNIYDRIMKMKPQHIDMYVNKYPSLLIDDSIDLKESRNNIDLNSTIRSKRKNSKKADEELIVDEDCTNKLFIQSIDDSTAAFSNYNSSIHIDVIIKKEYMPENANEQDVDHDPEYDGFSVWMAYGNNKYNVVPRVMMHKKIINTAKWFIDNIDALLNCATGIVNGDVNQTIYVDNFKLIGYLIDMPDHNEQSILKFKQLEKDTLIFVGTDENNRITTAYCEYKPGYNRFEVILKNVEFKNADSIQNIEYDKTVGIGNGYQPLITLLEKMPELIKNIDLVINNQDIVRIVLS